MAIRNYFHDSRAPRYSVLFAFPLLIAYEVSAFLLSGSTGTGVRNGADVLLKSLFALLGGHRGLFIFEVLLVGIGIWVVARDWKAHRGSLRPAWFALMLAESVVLAVLVGIVVGQLTVAILPRLAVVQGPGSLDTATQLMISLGAGIYEELLFRVILVGSLAWSARRFFDWSPNASGVFAAVLGAFIFSAFHYVGAYGDPLRLDSFTFRMIAGLVFSGLYLTRGFGITAWTHALYDVLVTLS
ncbi:MAG: CPBP family intramembrane glutamic endopeptidase [Gemmatimonadales bacterium]